MRGSHRYFHIFASILFLTTACDSSVFGSRGGKRAQNGNSSRSPNEIDSPLRGDAMQPQPTDNPNDLDVNPDPNKKDSETTGSKVDLCPEGSKSFSVLILDLKSGWFAGDGGDFFKSFVSSNCKDTVKLSYIHLTKELVEGNMSQADISQILPCASNMVNGRKEFSSKNADNICSFESFSGYNQLWLLSGSTVDPVDIGTESILFKSITTRANELKQSNATAGFFVGAGLRNTIHANSYVASVFSGEFTDNKLFANLGGDQVVFPNPTQLAALEGASLVAGNGLTAGQFSPNASAFLGLQTLTDYKKQAGRTMTSYYKWTWYSANLGECLTSPIYAPNNAAVLPVIATDHCGQPAIAAGKVDGHKVFAEGNMARFYRTKPEAYFHRIILSLLP